MASDKAFIQVQDIYGQWRSIGSTINQDQAIKSALNSAQTQYKRIVRAVDKNGNILQLQ